MNPTLKKIGLLAAKIGVSVAILGYLIFSAFQNDDFVNMLAGWRNWLWWRLAGAVLLVLAAVALTVFRWQMLARTLGLEFTTREALRVGFLGYAVNLLPLGLVGGDAVKAVFLARLNPTRRTEAVATVFVDRVIGLVALLILAALGTLLIDVNEIGKADAELQRKLSLLCWVIRGAALAGIAAAALLFVPGFTTSSFWNRLAKIPVLGGIIQKLVGAMHIYSGRADRLLLAMLMSLSVHLLFVGMIYVIGSALLDAHGQPTPQPPLLDHAVFVPLAMAAGTLPQGFLEWLLKIFYEAFSPTNTANKGLLIALVYRAIQVAAAGLGMAPFLLAGTSRPIIHAEELLDKDLLPRSDAAPLN
ncbi:MAG: flippase-like domain-containing protein [Pirellulaceae bacterium]|nr:flippase-like domain-containing protein [Pirellulaceae bacterium]